MASPTLCSQTPIALTLLVSVTLSSGTTLPKNKNIRDSTTDTLWELILYLAGTSLVAATLDSRMVVSTCGKKTKPKKLSKLTQSKLKLSLGETTFSTQVELIVRL
jgi:hypothetical protein